VPGFTNYVRDTLLRVFAGDTDPHTTIMPGWQPCYITLLTQAPTDDGTSISPVEPDGTVEWAVTRIDATLASLGTANEGNYGGRQLENLVDFSWSTTDTSTLLSETTLVAGAVYDGLTSNNMLAWDYLTTPITIQPGTEVVVPAGNFVIRMHKELL